MRSGWSLVAATVVALAACNRQHLAPVPTMGRRVGLAPVDSMIVIANVEEVGEMAVQIDTSIAVPGQSIRVPVHVRETGMLNVFAEAGADGLDLTLTILDANEGRLAYVNNSRGRDPQTELAVRPGQYTIQIGTYGTNVRTGALRVVAWMAPLHD